MCRVDYFFGSINSGECNFVMRFMVCDLGCFVLHMLCLNKHIDFIIFQVVWHGHAFDVVIKCVSNDAAQTTTHALTTVLQNVLHKHVHAHMFWYVYQCINTLHIDYVFFATYMMMIVTMLCVA